MMKQKTYNVLIKKFKGFSLNDILIWIDSADITKRYKQRKHDITFSFKKLNEAFRFQMRWRNN